MSEMYKDSDMFAEIKTAYHESLENSVRDSSIEWLINEVERLRSKIEEQRKKIAQLTNHVPDCDYNCGYGCNPNQGER